MSARVDSVAILVPVLGRPHRVRPLVENIQAVTPEPHTIYFCASDQPTIDELKRVMGTHVWAVFDEGDTWPKRINRLFTSTEEPYIFTAADDLLFHEHWLSEAMRAMKGMREEGVVVVEDMHNPNGTMALIARTYIMKYGGSADVKGQVMHPGYTHNWSDTELFSVAQSRRLLVRCRTSVVEHLHHEAGKMPWDDTYAKGMEHELEDRMLFRRRRRLW